MKNLLLTPLALLLFLSPAFSAEPPEKALKYHEALLKRPSNDTLFDRFFSAWIDEQDITELEKFLTARAEQNNGPDLAVLSRFHLRRGNEDAALDTLAKAIAALPEDLSLPMERAKILLRRLDFDNARKDLTTIANGTDPTLALDASKLIGKSYLREGNTPEAIKTWDSILAKNPNDEDLLEDLVESAATEGEIDQALIYVDKLITASSDPYKKTLRQLRRGDLLSQAARHDDAIKAYSETLTNTGEGSWLEREIIAQIDKAFRKQDRIDDLKTTLETLATENPRRLLIHRELARIEAAQGETDAAIGRFREVLKRSPGNRELLEEFVRLLIDSENFDLASTEITKLIELAPQEHTLLFQLADLQFRQNLKPETLATLQKAHTLLGIDDESAGIRIASLMFQYGLNENGETILKKLSTAQNASEAPSEALASEYARTNRKPEALEILKKLAASDNLETILRSAASISALSESNIALEVLTAKNEAFQNDPRFLTAITQASLAAGKPDVAITHAIKLIRLASPATELAEAIALSLRAITEADQIAQWRETLEKQPTRSTTETCLLAALAEYQADYEAVAKIMANASDPTLIRFHTAILDRRGEIEQAIKILSTLATTDEGRKTSYFKDMADLQRRAGLTDEALATVDLWKQSNPGDKTAWVTTSQILRDEGRPEDAIKATRQAVARFGEDTDIAATLASLHEDAGETEEAEAIYWRLYDNSASPLDQARWAALLAQLAHTSGRTEELSEKLSERARNNRRSIGPILAQAELARITRNDEKRRDLLLEAVRLQPKDIDLRLQIANLEDQAGNPDRIIAILEEALPIDTTNRIRAALAQAYLRQGQTIKGMRELRILAGTQADDPRTVEQSATSLAGSGLYDEAIRFLKDALPDGGDWRTKYLLAVLLEHDGRETEAIPLFQSLLQASGEIPSIKLPSATNRYNPFEDMTSVSDATKKLFELSGSSQAAYAHTSQNSYWSYFSSPTTGSMVGPFMLPNAVEAVRTFSLIHLAKLKVDGLPNGDFLKDFLNTDQNGQPNFPELLSKYPDHPGLLEIVLIYAGWNDDSGTLDLDLLRKILAKRTDLSPSVIFSSKFIFASAPNVPQSAWDELVSAAKELAKSSNKQEAAQVGYQLMAVLSQPKFKLPETTKTAVSQIVLDLASNDSFDDGPFEGFKLYAITVAGNTDQWIEAANQEIDAFRKKFPKGAPSSPSNNNILQMSNMGGMSHSYLSGHGVLPSPFILPNFESTSLTTLPPDVLAFISNGEEGGGGYYGSKPISPASLIPKIEAFSSPVIRAYIALRAADQEAIEKYLNVTPPENETVDFATLRSLHAISKKDFATAYQSLSSLRTTFAADRNRISTLNIHLLAIAAEMTAEERTKISSELEALLIQTRRSLGSQGGPILAAHAEKLGLSELAKRFTPKTPNNNNLTPNPLNGANFGARQQPQQSGNATVAKMKKFATDGKHEAAALEALNLIRKAYKNQYNRSYELREIREAITPETVTELLKISNPGDSTSLTKITEYADICIDFGKPEEALTVLTRIHEQRPTDANIAAKLAFLLPPDQQQKAVQLLNTASKLDTFSESAFNYARNLSDSRDSLQIYPYFDTIAAWLESTPPEDLTSTNLTWISYYSKNFIEGQFFSNLSGLNNSSVAANKEYAQYIKVAKRLTTAMLKHPATAEEGFRLNRYSQAWKTPDNELDTLARNALLAGASLPPTNNRNGNHSFFSYRTRNGGSSSGDDLDELSSALWLSSRLASAKSPDEILPPAYLSQLKEKNPSIGELTAALATLKDIQQVETIWKSDSFSKESDPYSEMLRNAIRSRAATIPKADAFFLKLIREIKPLWFEESQDNSDTNLHLIRAAISSSSTSSPKHIDELTTAISKIVFGETINYEDKTQRLAYSISTMEQIFSEAKFQPAALNQIIRSLHAKNIPLGQEYTVRRLFQNIDLPNIQVAEKTFKDLGLLEPIESWKPLRSIHIDTDYNGNEIKYLRIESFVQTDSSNYLNFSFSNNDFVKHLEKIKPQTFGTLISAASISYDRERERLTALAFSQNAKKIAALPKEKIDALNHLVSWLPANAIPSLPPALRKQFDDANKEKHKNLITKADEFINNKIPSNINNSPLDEAQNLVIELAPVDLQKAAAVFLEAERRFTENLSKGGRLSTYTSSDIQITERDETLQDICSSFNDSDHLLSLAFHQAVAASPEATRFSFSDPGKFTPLIYNIGNQLSNSTPSGNDKNIHHSLRPYLKIKDLPQNIQNDAYFALGTYLIGNSDRRNSVKPQEFRVALEKNKDIPEIARQISTLHIGVSAWNSDAHQRKVETQKAFSYIASFPDVPSTTRFQILFTAAYMAPAMLTDTTIAEALTQSFEQYAAGDRSVINSLGLYIANIITMAPVLDETRPFLTRLNTAFWNNASSPKSGGHPEIPQELASNLLMASAASRDDENTKKLVNLAKAEILGDSQVSFALITHGYHDLAKQILCPLNKFHPIPPSLANYHSFFEKQFEEFRKSPGINPLSIIRLETLFLDVCVVQTGEYAPSESRDDREKRIIAAYLANPPADIMLRTEIVARLSRNSHTAAIALRDEIFALRKQLNLKNSLEDWGKGVGEPTDLIPRHLIAPAETVIFRQAAFLQFLDGDLSGLREIAKIIDEQTSIKVGNYGTENYLESYFDRIHESAPLWIIEAVINNKTDSFNEAYDVFSEFLAIAVKRTEFDKEMMTRPLSMAEFFANWNGDSQKFIKLFNDIKREKNGLEYFRTPEGLYRIAYYGFKNRLWTSPSFKEKRLNFFLRCFTRKEMSNYYGSIPKWFPHTADTHSIREDMLSIAANPPADISPSILAHLLKYRAEDEFKQNRFDSGVTSMTAAINTCPQEKPWNDTRLQWSIALCDKFLAAKKPEEALKFHAQIKTEGLNPQQTKNLQTLFDKIQKAMPK